MIEIEPQSTVGCPTTIMGRVDKSGTAKRGRRLVLAQRHHHCGRLRRAERIYRELLRDDPADAELRGLIAVTLHQRGCHAQGEALIREAIADAPGDSRLHFNLAEMLRAADRVDEAVEAYLCATAIDPQAIDAALGLADVLLAVGRAPEAVDAYTRVLTATPADVDAHCGMAAALAVTGAAREAIAHYDTAIALDPGRIDAARARARLQLVCGTPLAAAIGLRAAIERAPQEIELRLELAALQRRCGESREADSTLLAAVPRASAAPASALHGLAAALAEAKLVDAAERCYRRLLASNPDDADAHAGLGGCLQRQGRLPDADRCQRAALALSPGHAEACFQLSMMRRLSCQREVLWALERRGCESARDESERAHLQFALAAAYEHAGWSEEAWPRLLAANAQRAARAAFDPDAFDARIDRLIEVFNRALIERSALRPEPLPRPIFIVGMPRSGSTLVERILATSPVVAPGGESDALRAVVRHADLRYAMPFPDWLEQVDVTGLERLRARYFAESPDTVAAAPRFSDKLLGNFLRLGLIAILFPGARIVHCVRDPRDTCVSCFFQDFAHGMRFAYDLTHLGRAYRGYQRLMAHWRKTLPTQIHEVHYEALVADSHREAERLFAYCGVEGSPDVQGFAARGGVVHTASTWQVRQPLYSSSVGRWKRYRAHLGPLLVALGEPC